MTPTRSPASPGKGARLRGSSEDTAAKARAESATVADRNPTVSSVGASGTTPLVLITPQLGLNPTQPHSAAGIRTLPAVSVPSASGTMPAATAAAEPPDEPPDVSSGFQGFCTGP